MPTVIDSLLITLGLDAKSVGVSAKAVSTDIKRIGEVGVSSGKDLDKVAQTVVAGLQKIRTEILGLFALLLAGRGLEQFTSDILKSDAALGRTATNLGLSTASLAAWGEAVKRAGGNAAGVQGSIRSLNAEFEMLRTTGESDEKFIPYMNLLGVRPKFDKSGLPDMNALLTDLSGALSKKSPRDAQFIGQQLGLDEGTINLLRQGPGAVTRALADAQARGVPTDEDAKRSQALVNSFYDLQQQIESLDRSLLNDLSPTITELEQEFSAWLLRNKPAFETDLKAFADGVIHFFKDVDWGHVTADLEAFGHGVIEVTSVLRDLFDRIAAFLGMAVSGGSVPSANGGSGYPGVAPQATTPYPATERKGAIDQAIDYFTSSAGGSYTPAQAAGIVGNLMQESNLNPLAHDKYGMKGIAQWDATRQAEIEAQFGQPVQSMSYEDQLAAVAWELRNKERATGEALRGVLTPEDAAAIFARGYERPANLNVEVPRRGNMAAHAYSTYLQEVFRRQQEAARKKADHDQDLKNVLPLNNPDAPYVFGSLAPTNASRFSMLTSSTTNNVSTETHIGAVNINTQATDAKGIAGAMKSALASTMMATQMNRGLA